MFPRVPQPRSGPRPVRDALRRAADLVVAFATLEDASSPHDHPGDDEGHPHRRSLRAPSRARRPGSVRARPALCAIASQGGHRASGHGACVSGLPADGHRACSLRGVRHNADEPPVGGSSK
jgi:hypothetical protein